MADICHLNLAPHFRGGERQTELLVRALAEQGLAQRLVIKRGNSLAQRCADIGGLEIREVSPNPLAAGLAIRGSKISHAHDGRTVYSALFARLVYGVPYVITRRVVAQQSASFWRRLAYRKAKIVAAVSSAAARQLQVRQPEVTPVVVPDAVAEFAVDEDAVADIRARWPGKTLIGHVGALDDSHKGQSTLIDLARRVVDTRPDWQFLLCGNGRDEARFRHEAGGLPNVSILGWIDGVGDYLAAFDVFVYPSRHEALGSTLLDAMWAGLPIIASNVGGIPDIVEHGTNGLLVDPERPDDWLGALESLLADDEKRAAMARANRETSQNYSPAQMAAAYLRAYGLV